MLGQEAPQSQVPAVQYVLVPQQQRMNYIAQAPLMIQMPIIQRPKQPAIPYERFLPPTPKLRQDEPPKIYQFYKYVPTAQIQVQQQPVQQVVTQQVETVQPVMQTYQTMNVATMPAIINAPIVQ